MGFVLLFMLLNCMSSCFWSRVVMSTTIYVSKRSSIRLDSHLLCRGFMFYLCYLYVIFLLVIVLKASDCPFGIFKLIIPYNVVVSKLKQPNVLVVISRVLEIAGHDLSPDCQQE